MVLKILSLAQTKKRLILANILLENGYKSTEIFIYENKAIVQSYTLLSNIF